MGLCVLGDPLGKLGRVASELEGPVIVLCLTRRLRRAPQPHDRVDALLALPQRIRCLQRPDHILGVGVDRDREGAH